MESHNTVLNWIGNIASVGAIITSYSGIVPAAGAIVAIIWYAIQIKESTTFKRWRLQRRQRKLNKLKAELVLLEETILLLDEPDPPSGPAGR